jgi:hypothetical protein
MNFKVDYDFLGLSEPTKIKGLVSFQTTPQLEKPELKLEVPEPIPPKNNIISYVAPRKSKSKLFW